MNKVTFWCLDFFSGKKVVHDATATPNSSLIKESLALIKSLDLLIYTYYLPLLGKLRLHYGCQTPTD